MSKKTALDLACEEFNRLIYSEKTGLACGDCPAVIGCELNCVSYSVENCTKNLKQYFQQKADISDGWDVIKKWIKEESTRMEHIDERMASMVLRKLCKKYGIEIKED